MKPDWYEETSLSAGWRYAVTETITFPNVGKGNFWGRYNIHSFDGPRLGDLTPEYGLRIFPGYMFDGATFAPDCRALMPAFVLHDLLCQCVPHYPRVWPISRYMADRAFLTEGLLRAPIRARLYYAGIRLGGDIHRTIIADPHATLTIRKA